MVSHVYKTENRAILDLTVARPDGREEVIGVTGTTSSGLRAKAGRRPPS
jgi:hypothetical protein